MAKPKPSTVVVSDPIARIDAAVADLRKRRAALDQRVATATADELAAEGGAIAKAQAALDRQLTEMTERRIAAIAGLPVDLDPPRKAEPPRAALPPLARRVTFAGGKPDSDPEIDKAAKVADSKLRQAQEVAERVHGARANEAVSVSRAHSSSVDFALGQLYAGQEEVVEAVLRLAKRVAELEGRIGPGSGLRYFGSYQRAQDYPQGAAVSDGGNLYIALRGVAEGEQPRDCPEAWQLAVRRGRDGKDAEPQRKTIRYSAAAEGDNS